MSAIDVKPFLHEAEVAVADGALILRLNLDFAVIDRIEGLLGPGLDELLGQLFVSTSVQGKFLWAMTRKHHPDLSLDQVAGVQFSKDGPAVMAALGNLVRNGFHFGEGAEGEQGSRPPRAKPKHPPKPKPKDLRGASSGSSPNGAPRGSARRTSGAKPRARS